MMSKDIHYNVMDKKIRFDTMMIQKINKEVHVYV
jgi:hypothetical protein